MSEPIAELGVPVEDYADAVIYRSAELIRAHQGLEADINKADDAYQILRTGLSDQVRKHVALLDSNPSHLIEELVESSFRPPLPFKIEDTIIRADTVTMARKSLESRLNANFYHLLGMSRFLTGRVVEVTADEASQEKPAIHHLAWWDIKHEIFDKHVQTATGEIVEASFDPRSPITRFGSLLVQGKHKRRQRYRVGPLLKPDDLTPNVDITVLQ